MANLRIKEKISVSVACCFYVQPFNEVRVFPIIEYNSCNVQIDFQYCLYVAILEKQIN